MLDILIENVRRSAFTISVDWLEVCGVETDRNGPEWPGLPMPTEADQAFEYGDVVLLAKPYGTSLYQACFEVLHHGEAVATLMAHPRKVGTFKKGGCHLRLLNHVLYRADYLATLYDICEALSLDINNVTRLDVALDFDTDGLPHLREFLNYYLHATDVHLRGKATLSGRDWIPSQKGFNQFVFGSSKSAKQVSVYNKSQEIQESCKDYIRAAWKANGLTGRMVYRVELRLWSKGIKDLPTFDITELDNGAYLASLVRTGFENFFQFAKVIPGDSNTRRYPDIELFDWANMGAVLLPKSQAAPVNDSYKVRLALHKAVKFTMLGTYRADMATGPLEASLYDVGIYQMQDYAARKIPQWIDRYSTRRTPEERPRLIREVLLNRLHTQA